MVLQVLVNFGTGDRTILLEGWEYWFAMVNWPEQNYCEPTVA